VATIDKIHFDFLYRQNYLRIKSFVLKHGFCESIADDIVQDSFINAWEKRSSLRSIETFGPWIRAISRNLCFLHLRSKRVVSMSEIKAHRDLCEFEEIGDAEEFINWIESENNQVWNRKERELALEALYHSIEHMSDSIRKKIGKLFYLEHRSVHEIGLILDIKQNTILSHLRRFRKELSRDLVSYDPGLDLHREKKSGTSGREVLR
jgi:RNA polymerase sigma factor (sigma-70 family)